MLTYLPVTSRPLIFLQKEAVLSPCNFATAHPEGPEIENVQDFPSGLKFSSDQCQIENFNRDWKFQARMRLRPLFVGKYQGRYWKFQSRLRISIEIENFKPGLKFSSVWIENFTRSIGIEFFQSQGPLGIWQPAFWIFISLKLRDPCNGRPTPEKSEDVPLCRTLRAQRLKKIKIALQDWNFQSRLKISSEPPSKPLFFVGKISSGDWTFSIEIEVFKRDWKFQARLKFFNLWALREPLKTLEKRAKTHKKARKTAKRSKRGKQKKQGLEGQGNYELSGPVWRDTARPSQRYLPVARYGVLASQHGQFGAIPPPVFWAFPPKMRQKCAEHLCGRTPFGRYRLTAVNCQEEVHAELPRMPNGPFRTKNTTALNSVVFCYCHGFFLLSVAICCLISL